jgi:hypothetical protein
MNVLNFIAKRRWVFVLMLVAIGWGCTGCGSTEAENTSSRPWNSPEGWQNGSAGMVAPPR